MYTLFWHNLDVRKKAQEINGSVCQCQTFEFEGSVFGGRACSLNGWVLGFP